MYSQIHGLDGFPQSICNNCKEDAVKSYKFRILCEATGKLLETSKIVKMEPTHVLQESALKIPDKEDMCDLFCQRISLSERFAKCDVVQTIHEENQQATFNSNEIRIEEVHLTAQYSLPDLSFSVLFDCKTSDFLRCRDQENKWTVNIFTLKTEIPTTSHDIPFGQMFDYRGESIYKCESCEFNSYSVLILTLHLQRHQKSRIIKSNKDTKENKTRRRRKDRFETEEVNKKTRLVKKANVSVKTENAMKGNMKMHKCPQCSYKANHRGNLNKHILYVHTPKENIKWHKCDLCDFKSKSAGYLKQHSVCAHTKKESVKWFGCEECEYKTNYKSKLKKHFLNRHTKEQDIEWYKCEYCDYKSKAKSYIKHHVLNVHTKSLQHFEAKATFETSMNHLVNVNSKKDVKWHKCDYCQYKSRVRSNMKQHLVNLHSKEDDVHWYKCELCEYKTKVKANIKQHSLNKHTDKHDIKWYNCDYCDYKSKVKSYIKHHILSQHTK